LFHYWLTKDIPPRLFVGFCTKKAGKWHETAIEMLRYATAFFAEIEYFVDRRQEI